MIDRAALEKHRADLVAEYERGESMLARAKEEVKRVEAARLNIAGAITFCEALLAESNQSEESARESY